ncbi:haloacid dehalogenase type II [Pontibacillus salicampi]|uniref:Haloacid dehalogenase type II n=1 Tax=Pontibacillus salicampi TaxID=1449801 RepID=A0ABV6LIF8_9BACI
MNIKAFVFDAYGTLFDVHSVRERLDNLFPDNSEAISQSWRSKQVHYFFIRQLIDGYEPFNLITKWALQDALIENGIEYNKDIVEDLMEAYKQLKPYEEVRDVLQQLENHQRVIFSNGTQAMLEPLLEYNGLDQTLGLLSADQIHIYKPSPDAYQFALNQLGVSKEEVLFMSSNPWDIAGAKHFGFNTAWISRDGKEFPQMGLEPDRIYQTLAGIVEWS